jgi:hypothetical protein
MKQRAQTDWASDYRPDHGGLTPGRHNPASQSAGGFVSEEYMLAKAFVVAMAADIARSDYAKPTIIRGRGREWLIACRWGSDGEYLSIATAGAILGSGGVVAPDAIAPIHSLFGVLVSESEKEAASTFLLVRQLPIPIELAGTFFPADGYALLQQRETITLASKVRYSHSCGWLDGREVRKDIPDPAPSSVEAMAWHIEARRCGWIGEFIPETVQHEKRVVRASG